mmetsp:Transcript_26335/g.40402  ORF Transcript_26335/g.40402 Transcript_26335/m.40402 type:complete len:306 (+) Transcript_26335:80-997(+)
MTNNSATAPSSPFRSDCLHGKVALVTGGGSGICFEITKQLLLHGCDGVVICGRREAFLQKATDALSLLSKKPCYYSVCDVRDAESCRRAVNLTLEKFNGRLDILINGAAGNFLSTAETLKPKGFQTVMEIDAQGTFNMTHMAFNAMKNGGGGIVINITATLQYGATWYQCHASAAKSAVDSLTRSLALEWGSDNIRVVGIAPGPIADTPGTTKLAPGLDGEAVEELVKDGIPLGRMGKSWDIGMAAVYLCSSAGSYVTGDVLVVDGGEWLYRPPIGGVPKEMVSELSRRVEGKSRAQAPKLTSKL